MARSSPKLVSWAPMRNPYVHPFLATAFPLLFLYAHNAHEVSLADVWSTLVVATLATALAMLALRSIPRPPHQRTLLLTLAILLFYSYGHAVRFAPQATRQRLGMSPEAVAGALWTALAVVAVLWTLRLRRGLLPMTFAANVITSALVAVQLASLGYAATTAGRAVARAPVAAAVEGVARYPEIYFIVLDGYARDDVLQRLYAHDNAAFLDSLRAMGFRVAERSRSNYCQTILSLAATLNLDYIPNLIDIDPRSRDRRPVHRLINQNRLFAELRQRGYSTVAFASGFGPSELNESDHYLRPSESLSEFQQIVVSTTPLPLVLRFGKSQYDLHRDRIDFILRELPRVRVGEHPRFVFAHLVTPHPPFVFGRRGEPIARDRRFDFGDGSHFYDAGGSQDEYVGKYRDQLVYVSARILATLRGILRNSSEPPVIVLQSDHGPGSELHWSSLQHTDVGERFGILNALLLPGVSRSTPADFSPVNTFRLILNEYGGARYDMLPHRSEYTVLHEPYRYFDIDSLATERKSTQ